MGMKVAFLLTASPRFCNEFDKFINSLKNFSQVDYFCYLWNNNQPPDKPGYEDQILLSERWRYPDPMWAEEKIKTNLPSGHILKRLVFQDPERIPIPKVTPHGAVVWSVWRMHYSWHQADLLRQQEETVSGPYDLIIRGRPDIGIVGDIDLTGFKNTDSIWVPNHGWHGFGHSICDIMALGTRDTMKTYCDVINHSLHYVRNGACPFHPETMLAYHLRANKIPVRPGNWGYTIRPDLYKVNDYQTVNFGRWS